MDRLDLLRQISIFEGLVEHDLEVLASHLAERRLRSGETVFTQGSPGSAMFIVSEGHVNIFLPGEASRRISLKDVGKGEYFGELALFDQKPRSASAITTSETVLFELNQETLKGYLATRPGAAVAILRTMAERLRETNVLLSERAARNAFREVEQHLTFGERFADKVADMNGSWSFILALIVVTGAWILVNTRYVLSHPFDEYPYVFFNLVLAILVAFQGPLIVMSQNRQTSKDRAQAETDYRVNLKNEVNIETILRELGEFRAEMASREDAPKRARAGPE
jgi:uncharacterized membrane protein